MECSWIPKGDKIIMSGGNADTSVITIKLKLADALVTLMPVDQPVAPPLYRPATGRPSPIVLNCREGTPNIGDLSCSPADFFALGAERGNLMTKLVFPGQAAVVGGGGLLSKHFLPAIKRIADIPETRLILWGVGLNHDLREFPEWLSACVLVGVRNRGLPKNRGGWPVRHVCQTCSTTCPSRFTTL